MAHTTPIHAQAVSLFIDENTPLRAAIPNISATWAEGFYAWDKTEGVVKVEYTTGSNSGGNPEFCDKLRKNALDEMEGVLSACYTVERKRDQWAPNAYSAEYLVITSK